LHFAARDERTPLALVLTPGQTHDAQVFTEVLAAVPEAVAIDFAVADKAFDSDAIRWQLLERDIAPVIPSKINRTEPIEHDVDLYRERNRIERLVGKLKQFRRIATRYDKLAASFLAFIHLTAAFIMIR
jgi:transposase